MKTTNLPWVPVRAAHALLGTISARRYATHGHRYNSEPGRVFPPILLVYNNIDPWHAFGTEDHHFIHAMYGEYTLRLDRETGRVVDAYHGRNRARSGKKYVF